MDEVKIVIESPPDVGWERPPQEESDTWSTYNVSESDFFCGVERARNKEAAYEIEYRCERSPFLAMILVRMVLNQMGEQDAKDALESLPLVTLGTVKKQPGGQERAKTISVYVMNEEKRAPKGTGIQKTTLYDLFKMSAVNISKDDLMRLAKVSPSASLWDRMQSWVSGTTTEASQERVEDVKHSWDKVRIKAGEGGKTVLDIRLCDLVAHLRLDALGKVMDVIDALGTRMNASFVELDPKYITVYHDWARIRRIAFEMEGIMSFSIHLGLKEQGYDFAVTNDLLRSRNELRLSDFLLDFISGGKLKVAVRLLTSDKKYDAAEDAQRLMIRLLYASGKVYAPNIGGLFEHYPFRCLMNAEMKRQIETFQNVKKMDVHSHNEELPKLMTDFKQYVGTKMGETLVTRAEYDPDQTPEVIADPTLAIGISTYLKDISRRGYGADFFTAQKNPGSVWLLKMREIVECVNISHQTIGYKIFSEVKDVSIPPWNDESNYFDSVMTEVDEESVDGEEIIRSLQAARLSRGADLMKIMREKTTKGGLGYLNDPKRSKKPVMLNDEAFRKIALTSDSIREILDGNWKLADNLSSPMDKCIIKEEEVGSRSFLAGGAQGKIFLMVIDKRRGKKDELPRADITKNTAEYFKRLEEIIEKHQNHKYGPGISYIRMLLVRNIINLLTSESAIDITVAIREVGEIVDITNEFADGDKWTNGAARAAFLEMVEKPLPSPLSSEEFTLPRNSKMDPQTIDRAVDEMMNIFKFANTSTKDGDVGGGGITGLEDYVRSLVGSQQSALSGVAALYGNVRNALRRTLMISYSIPQELPIKSAKGGLTIEEFMKTKFDAKMIQDAKKYEGLDYEIGALKKFPAVPSAEMKTEYFDKESKEIRSSETMNEMLNSLICSIHYEEGMCPFFIRCYGGFTCAATDSKSGYGISQAIATIQKAASNPSQFALDLILKQTIGFDSKMLVEPTPAPPPKSDGAITTFLTMELIDDTLANFPRLYATLYNKFYKHMKTDRPTYHECLTNAIQQSVLALAYFQKYMQGMHFDLHPGNIFIKICDKTEFNGTPICDYPFFECTIGTKVYRIKNLGFLCKIGDMGHAVIKLKLGPDGQDGKTVRKIPLGPGLGSITEYLSVADQYFALRRILMVSFKFIPIIQLFTIAEVRIAIENVIGANIANISPSTSVFNWIALTAASFVTNGVLFNIPGVVGRVKKFGGYVGSAIGAGLSIPGSIASGAIALVLDFLPESIKNLVPSGATLTKGTVAKDQNKGEAKDHNESTLYLWIESMVFSYLSKSVATTLSKELNKLINPVRTRASGAFYPGYDLGTLINGCSSNKMLWLNPAISYYFQMESLEHMSKYGDLKNVQFMEFGDGLPQLSGYVSYFYPDPKYTITSPFDMISKMLDGTPEAGPVTQEEEVNQAFKKRTPPPLPPKPYQVDAPPPLPPKPDYEPIYPGIETDPGIELTNALEFGDDADEPPSKYPRAEGRHHGRQHKKKARQACLRCTERGLILSCRKCKDVHFCSMQCYKYHWQDVHGDED